LHFSKKEFVVWGTTAPSGFLKPGQGIVSAKFKIDLKKKWALLFGLAFKKKSRERYIWLGMKF
jgi:hypothetical protein